MFIIIAPGMISLNTLKMDIKEEICQKDFKISGEEIYQKMVEQGLSRPYQGLGGLIGEVGGLAG